MKLTALAFERINVPVTRMKIAIALGITEQSVIKAIRNKSDVLTKYAAIQVIKKETGLKESEILENVMA